MYEGISNEKNALRMLEHNIKTSKNIKKFPKYIFLK